MEKDLILGVPRMFPSDLMHHTALNIPQHNLKLWSGKVDCSRTDRKGDWYWVVLKGQTWETHGEAIANCTPYLPGLCYFQLFSRVSNVCTRFI